MSDITHARKAQELLDFAVREGQGNALEMAGVRATLAVSGALREIDTTIRQRLTAIETAAGHTGQQAWLQWQDTDGYQSIPVNRIVKISQDRATGGTIVVTVDGEVTTTLSFAQVSLQVGAE